MLCIFFFVTITKTKKKQLNKENALLRVCVEGEMYKSYGLLRPLVCFAGIIGILQSLIWIAMSILSILAYFCVFNFRGMIASLGTLTELTLFHMYFHGSCSQSGMPNIDFNTINHLNLIKPLQIHICMWVYCGISMLWLISSITLLTSVRYIKLRNANYFLFVWIFLTVSLSILDLGLGVAFGLDYDTLRHETHSIPVNEMVGTAQPQYLIVAAKTAAGIMMSVVLRGYTIWLINIVLCIYFFTQTFKISDYNRIKAAISNPMFTSPDGTMRKKMPHQSTNPYTEKDDQWLSSLQNYSYQMNQVDQPTKEAYRQNQAAALFEERKRHYEAQQLNYLRYIDKLNGRKPRGILTKNGHVMNGQTSTTKKRQPREIHLPEPDYSSNNHDSFETRPPLRSAMRSSRY